MNLDYGVSASPVQPLTSFFRDMEEYHKKAFREIIDLGLKIKNRNIFWFFVATDIETKQYGISIMIGDWTILDYQTKGIYK